MIWFFTWCGVAAAMTHRSIGEGLIWGMAAGTLLFAIQHVLYKRKLGALTTSYSSLYGEHPGYDDRAQRYAGTAGALGGGGFESVAYVAGSALGATLDYLRDRSRKKAMGPEQAALYDKLKAAHAWQPSKSFMLYIAWILLAAGGVHFFSLAFR